MKLTLAIPTGRIFGETVALLSRCGIEMPQGTENGRKLHVSAPGQTFVLAKDKDVPTYVAHGVADAGIVGRDVLAESSPEVYQPLDLGIGRCRMVVARPAGAHIDRGRSVVRVATKYPRVATKHFHGRGVPVEIIPLAGSVEIAPSLGLADCIVDLVQTGLTLEANGLVVDEVLFLSTAHLIVNRASYRLKTDLLRGLVDRLSKQGAG